jgi:epoxyqueuosine reductase
VTSAVAGLTERVKAHAYGLGFDLVGVTRLGPSATSSHLREWLANGYHGEMSYLDRGATLREDTTRPEPGMQSAIVVGLDYGARQPSGAIARYARGDDYHDFMRARLRELHACVDREHGSSSAARPYVDTGPILERELAQRAGLGWFGKNTMLINPSRGSFFFIGALFTSLELTPDTPFASDHCGTCTRCIDACPTDAIREPRVLDATRCISYLTIEHRSAIPEPLRPAMGELAFGCDVCQDVCPWNVRFGQAPRDGPLAPRLDRVTPDLAEILGLDDVAFRNRFRGSAITRTKRRGLARNIAVALGNRRKPGQRDLDALTFAKDHDTDPVVRDHAAWALDQIATRGTQDTD